MVDVGADDVRNGDAVVGDAKSLEAASKEGESRKRGVKAKLEESIERKDGG